MGAHNFSDQAKGKNINQAYRNACDSATYEYGHDPYNGTISTTDGVIDVTALVKGMSDRNRCRILDLGVIYDESVAPWDTVAEVKRVIRRQTKGMTAKQRQAVKIIAAKNISKRGPCVGCKLTNGSYHFAGWAAS